MTMRISSLSLEKAALFAISICFSFSSVPMAIYDSCSFKFVSFESLYLLRIIWRFDLSMRISAVLRAPQVCKPIQH